MELSTLSLPFIYIVEKGFKDMKFDLGALPVGVHSDDTMQGYLLVEFISCMIDVLKKDF